MKNFFKYGAFPAVVFLFLVTVTVMLMPVLINVQKYVPEIEKKIRKASGRPFSLGQDVTISFFPRLSLAFSDLKFGNPPGFVSDTLVKIGSFEAQIKVLPLLKKEIQFSRFVMSGLEVNLETNTEGKVNWQAMPLPQLDSIFCTLLAVTDGRLTWIDRKNHVRHSVEDIMLLANDVGADRQVSLDFKATYDGRPLALEGSVGPLHQKQGEEALPVDIGFRWVDVLQGQIRGKVANWQSAPVYDFVINLPLFPPGKLAAALAMPLPLAAADSATLQTAELAVAGHGGRNALTIDKGSLRLDDTMVLLSGEVKNFEKPEIGFSLDLDHLDLDRYFPPGHRGRTKPDQGAGRTAAPLAVPGTIVRLADNVALAGDIKIGTLQTHGVTVTAAEAKIACGGGVFSLDQAAMKLYGGQLQGHLAAELAEGIPKVRGAAQVQGVAAETLLRDMTGKAFLTGTLAGDMALEYPGNLAGAPKGLSGEATLTLVDGAVLGVDLGQSLERRELVEAGPADDPKTVRTEFAEVKGGMAIDGGILEIREATLTSPAMAMMVDGRVDIPGRAWKLRVASQGAEVKPKKGKASLPLTLTGTLEKTVDKDPATGTGAPANVASLVDEKIPSPGDADVKGLVGKPLIDPAVVAQRFHLQRETIRRGEMKKQVEDRRGKIRINPLQEETSL